MEDGQGGPEMMSTASAPNCPCAGSLEQLLASGLGGLPELEPHLATCAECRRLVAALVQGQGAAAADASVTVRTDPLDGTGSIPTSAALPAGLPWAPGTRVGRYLIERWLGSGGMGHVFAAWDSELDRLVALKMVYEQGTAVEALSARLRREARALARLKHPNVVAVHDVGVHEDHVFLTMELIKGGSLRAWLAEVPRPWDEILGVLLQAGEGLAAAHKAGLVHRDFKPDNVLVGADGRVCVADLGLARSIRDRDPSHDPSSDVRTAEPLSIVTRRGAVVGSLPYLAPEQLQAGQASPLSDQFSYAVSVYEALLGQRPFSSTLPADDPARWQVIASPSAPRVPTWLRQVLLRALSQATDARFPDMDALLHALQLDPAKRRRRWLRVGVAAAALPLALIVGITLERRDSQMCQGASKNLTAVWDDATRRALKERVLATGAPAAEATFERLARIFDTYAHDWVVHRTEACEATRIRGEQSDAMLSLRMDCLDRRLRAFDGLRRVLETADAAMVSKAIEGAVALAPLSACEGVELRAHPSSAPSANRAAVQGIRDQLNEATALADVGRPADAEVLAQRMLADARALKEVGLEAEIETLIARTLVERGDYATAERAFYVALNLGEASGDDPQRAHLYAQLAQNCARQGRTEEAQRQLDLGLAVVERMGGSALSESELVNVSVLVAHSAFKFDQALEYSTRALALAEQVFGPDSPRMAPFLNGHANALVGVGRGDDALAVERRLLELCQRTYGPEAPATILAKHNIGVLLLDLGRTVDAEKELRAAALARERMFPDHPHTASALAFLGDAERRLGALKPSEEHLRRAKGLADKLVASGTLKKTQSSVLHIIDSLGRTLTRSGHPREALELYGELITSVEAEGGTLSPKLAPLLDGQAIAMESDGALIAARDAHERALVLAERSNAAPTELASYLASLGRWHLSSGAPTEAEALYRRSLALQEKALGTSSPVLTETLIGLGNALLARHQRDAARAELRRALDLQRAGDTPALRAEASAALAGLP
jgi:tetratricopeptide (TPR) repeat protein